MGLTQSNLELGVKCFTEALGTFYLVFIACMTIDYDAANGTTIAGFAIGLTLMIMVYAGGPLSGGHYNPAVTLGVMMTRSEFGCFILPVLDGVLYMGSQVGGAIGGAALAAIIQEGNDNIPLIAEGKHMEGMLAEFIMTMCLVYVFLNTAVAPEAAGKSYFGLSIGMTVSVGAYSVGNISGGVFNPAVALATYFFKPAAGHEWENFLFYFMGQWLGAIAAAFLYYHQHPQDPEIQAEPDPEPEVEMEAPAEKAM